MSSGIQLLSGHAWSNFNVEQGLASDIELRDYESRMVGEATLPGHMIEGGNLMGQTCNETIVLLCLLMYNHRDTGSSPSRRCWPLDLRNPPINKSSHLT